VRLAGKQTLRCSSWLKSRQCEFEHQLYIANGAEDWGAVKHLPQHVPEQSAASAESDASDTDAELQLSPSPPLCELAAPTVRPLSMAILAR